ncbi:hypothetical protein [Streptomyces sp. NPDC047014]|uniref:hypothetical protein n=1 Tax=Streptomyces sp. NPDC047014 TaxID=3155736 RepID=UPI0033F25598
MRIRIALSAAVTALGLLFLLPSVAHAHGDALKVVVTGQRAGHVTAEITWENDGDAVDEAVSATVNAVSGDGTRTMGPWILVRDPAAAPAGWTTAEVLPPGSWKVSVDVGFPELGHGELEVGVPVVDPAPGTAGGTGTAGTGTGGTATAGPGTPAPSVPAPAPSTASGAQSASAPSTATPPSPAPTASGSSQGAAVWWTTAGVAVTALAGAGVGLLLRRRRLRRRLG